MRTIVHLSDIHVGRLDTGIVAPLADAIRGVRPDLVTLSGDLTQRARVSQFLEARRFVDSFEAPSLIVPGNHDVPLWNAAARFLTPFRRYKRYITPDLEPVYQDEEVIVLGVNTARSLAWGEGRINAAQVERIVERLSGTPASLIRIIVTHHPFDLPPGVSDDRLLGRAHMAMAKLAAADADLFLAGHLHLSHIGHSAERYQIAGHSALIVQAGTVSTRGRGEQPSFNVLRVQRPRIAVGQFVWDSAQGRFTERAAGVYRHDDRGWIPEAAAGIVGGNVEPGSYPRPTDPGR
jgi:3',5'-cyclic AMP phosphodiesterase CpdA